MGMLGLERAARAKGAPSPGREQGTGCAPSLEPWGASASLGTWLQPGGTDFHLPGPRAVPPGNKFPVVFRHPVWGDLLRPSQDTPRLSGAGHELCPEAAGSSSPGMSLANGQGRGFTWELGGTAGCRHGRPGVCGEPHRPWGLKPVREARRSSRWSPGY